MIYYGFLPESALIRNQYGNQLSELFQLLVTKSTPTLGKRQYNLNFHFSLLWVVVRIELFLLRHKCTHYLECPFNHGIILMLRFRKKYTEKKIGQQEIEMKYG